MTFTKDNYKKYLRSIYLPTLELIVDRVVEDNEDLFINPEYLTENVDNLSWLIHKDIVYKLGIDKEIEKSHKEYVKEILESKSPPTNTETEKGIFLDTNV
tara:strand:- start:1650 stop:1949 length:300 start_codon:yes stop_codon:yes gene_type:complete